MNKLVVYDSQYGTSRRYAQWIAQQCQAKLLERQQVQQDSLAECQCLIYGAGVYAGSLTGDKWLAQQWPLLQGKKLIVFACGMLDPTLLGAVGKVRGQLAKVLPKEMIAQTQLFLLRGALDYGRMNKKHQIMMAGLRLFLKLKGKNRTPDEQMVLDSYGQNWSFIKETSAMPIVELIHRS